MKKIAFVMQVLTMVITLPLLTVLEINHVNEKSIGKKTSSYVNAPINDNAFTAAASAKLPS